MNKDYEIEDHWAVEIQEQYRAIKERTVTCIPADEAMRQARERITGSSPIRDAVRLELPESTSICCKYRVILPTEDELRAEIDRERAQLGCFDK